MIQETTMNHEVERFYCEKISQLLGNWSAKGDRNCVDIDTPDW